MPINANPGSKLNISLKLDMGLPESERPFFVSQFLTARESRKIERDLGALSLEIDEDKAIAGVEAVILSVVTGWDRMKLRGEPVEWGTPLHDFLSYGEIWELARELTNAPLVTENDKKKSLSQPTTTQGNSATDAITKANA